MDVFLDTGPGGQNQLLANNPTIVPFEVDMKNMAGLTFDPGFEPDWIAGDQFFTVCPGATPVRRSTWGALKSVYG